ncbi:MAG: fused MFS/spermidine synthase [Verrucomicrobiales bacterium]|nr:fused MFS/spermidine synthase [Verrucomicrobiales bacterium]
MPTPTTNPAGTWRLPFLATLLLLSGACALIYQTAWLREFRLIFGGSTPSAAAVLAIFMGGLGLGGIWFGRRAESTPDLLRLYAKLEIGIGVTAALTPLLLSLARQVYLKTGGVLMLGSAGAAVAQLVLAIVVIGVPCFLLGGNLPPAVKWIETDEDRQRGALGVIYGCNAFGALLGVLIGTFWSLEALGTRATLWCAAAINVLLGVVAWQVAQRTRDTVVEKSTAPPVPVAKLGAGGWGAAAQNPVVERAPARFLYGAAGVTGFTFFVTELVWYRMLTPLLGGSVYCFGLILATVLLGIAIGGWLYRWIFAGRPGAVTLGSLALISTAQAVAMAIPWALGDRLAVMSFHLQQARAFGFGGLILGFGVTTAALAGLPSVLAGIQFPLLVGLLGEGRREAARQVGTAYAANTFGAILGSLAGGFFLIPWLTAPGCWRLAVALTLGLGFVALLLWERPWKPGPMFGTVLLGGLAVAMAFHARGPTGAWRHTALGYGIVRQLPGYEAELEGRLRSHRREVAREYDGRESSIAVLRGDEGWALFSNGKADGSALSDAGTQIMLGLVGALQHPGPKSAFVIGLGTGTSAGWLADVRGMERVDVVELESRVVDVARDFFTPVNRGALSKTNVHVIIGDAREVLLATRQRYDLVVSEPPNPYRAGVANLFTQEYYRAVRDRLAPEGIFSQWLQGYQLDAESLQLVYATLLSVFPSVETWVTQENDLLFVCHQAVPSYSLSGVKSRIMESPMGEAIARAWQVSTVEGFFAHHVAGTATARRAAAGVRAVNTDDRNLLEYGMARSQLGRASFRYQSLMASAFDAGDDLPPHLRGSLNLDAVLEARVMMLAQDENLTDAPPTLQGDALARATAMISWGRGDFAGVMNSWHGPAIHHVERLMLAISASRAGTPEQARPLIELVGTGWPADQAIARGWLAFRHGTPEEAVRHVLDALRILKFSPWVHRISLLSLAELSTRLGIARPQDADALLQSWREPLAAGLLSRAAPEVWFRLAMHTPISRRLEVLEAMGPDFPWTREFLAFRVAVLGEAGSPLALEARDDFVRYLAQEGKEFGDVLAPLPAPGAPGSGH